MHELGDPFGEQRACRFCGCTEDSACLVDGVGCHWVAETVCSNPACMAADRAQFAATARDLRESSWRCLYRARLARGGYEHAYRNERFPELTLRKIGARGKPEVSRIFVGEIELPWGDRDAIIEALNARRAAAAQDQAVAS